MSIGEKTVPVSDQHEWMDEWSSLAISLLQETMMEESESIFLAADASFELSVEALYLRSTALAYEKWKEQTFPISRRGIEREDFFIIASLYRSEGEFLIEQMLKSRN